MTVGSASSGDGQVAETGQTPSQVDDRQGQVAQSGGGTQGNQQSGASQEQGQTRSEPTVQFDETQPDRPNPHRKGTTQYELYEARQEAARSRIRARELESANMTEQERIRRDLTEATANVTTLTSRLAELENTNRGLRAQIALAANGAVHPELLANRLSEDDLVDDKTAKAAAAALKKEFPQLFSHVVQGSADGANEGSAPRQSDMSSMFRRVARPS